MARYTFGERQLGRRLRSDDGHRELPLRVEHAHSPSRPGITAICASETFAATSRQTGRLNKLSAGCFDHRQQHRLKVKCTKKRQSKFDAPANPRSTGVATTPTKRMRNGVLSDGIRPSERGGLSTALEQ